MADEVDLPEGGNPEPTPQPRELSPVEQRAIDEGWVPQEEWSGNPDDWRPAKEFLDRGELFRKIEDQKRELKHLRVAIDDLGKHHAQVKQLAYKEALATLRAQKRDALEAGDHDAVVEIDDRIAETREAQKVAESKPQTTEPQEVGPNPEFVRWEARNAWYKSDRIMKAAADEVAREMYGRGFTDPVAILTEVDKQIRKEFPHKFNNPNRDKPGAVEGSSTKSGKSRDTFELSDDERRIMNRIVATGVMTKEKYIEELKATKGRGA